ncbi:GntR family transcriptional regulator [Microvirga sp. 3-52]|jgi:DNA-binding GntR family transcriptional regulator|nr:GntR family transcriptional regulator [Microvirga sp. 3-52]
MPEQATSTPPGEASKRRDGDVNLTNQAYAAIARMIRDRRLRGGEAIVEIRLAEVLGISRTPLREALQRLEGEGLVLKGSGRNYIVRKVDLGEYLQSLKVREILEPEAAVLALGRIPHAKIVEVRSELEALRSATSYHTDAHWRSDDSLHNMFIDYCSNDVMARILRSMRATTRLFEIQWLKDRLIPDSTEHLEIINALEAGDPKDTRKAVAAHIESLIRFAVDTVR